jgi:hypothetical protein
MRALSIRQPFAELILRGIKTVEYRSRPTRIIGERFWIYASKQKAAGGWQRAGKAWSLDLAMAGGERDVPPWMLELAEGLRMVKRGALLPTGVIVGSAVIERCVEIGEERSEVRSQRSANASPAPGLTSDLRPLSSNGISRTSGAPPARASPRIIRSRCGSSRSRRR